MFDKNGNIETGREVFYYSKGTYYLKTGKIDSAEHYFRKLLTVDDDANNRIAAYRGLSLLYNKVGNADSTAKYALLSYETDDTIVINLMKSSLPKMQAIYNYGCYQNAARVKSEEAKHANTVTAIVVGLLLILLMTTYVVINNIKRKKREENIRQRQDYENKLMVLEQTKADLQTLLEQTEEGYEKLIKEKTDSIKQLLKQIDVYKKKGETLEERLQSAKITIYFRQLALSVTQPTSDEWVEMRQMINCEIPNFYNVLNGKNSSLRLDEYYICMLVRLNFKPLEISNLTGFSQGNITNIRRRLLKKLFDKEGRPGEFDRLIMQITV